VRRAGVIAALAAAVLAPAGGAWASRTASFGSTLSQPATNFDPSATCNVQRPSEGAGIPSNEGTDTGKCSLVAVAYAATGAVAGRVNAPFSGVVRRLRLRSGAPGFVRVELVRLSKLDRDGGEAGAAAEKRSVKLFLHGRGIESFRVRLPVRKGDYLAFESASFTALRCTGDAVDDLIYEPLSAGPLDTVSDNDSCTLLVQALVSRK
jgi:hypothetical protein